MTTNDIGWAVYVDDDLPATNNDAGFEALTWVRVNGVQSIGEFGFVHAGIDVEDLGSGFTQQVKGMGSGMETPMVFREVAGDTGQTNMKTIADSQEGLCSIKLVKQGNAATPATGDPVFYAQGIAHSYKFREKSGSSHSGFSVVFRNNDVWVVSSEPV